jgi:perosamine synthetase
MKRALLKDFDGILTSGRLIMGPYLKRFETEFSAKVTSKNGIGLSSATAGLHLAMLSIGIGKGDEVIVPAKTFVSTANAVIFSGGTPVFCDVQANTMNMDPDSLRKVITRRTRAVVPVHVAGQPCDMKEIMEICNSKSIDVVEDSAHAPYALYKGKCAGTFGRIGVFSFYPDKVIGSADGGMLVTDDDGIAETIRLLRNCGRTTVGDDNIQLIGYNYRMNEFQAAICQSQLNTLDSMIAKRNELARCYDELLAETQGVVTPFHAPNRTHDFYAYVVWIKMQREEFRERLKSLGVETSNMFDPIYKFKPYVELYGSRDGLCPVAERISAQTISIPLHTQLSLSDLEYVSKSIKFTLGNTR